MKVSGKVAIIATVALAFVGRAQADDGTFLDNIGWTGFFVGTVDMCQTNVEQRLIDRWEITIPADFKYGELAQYWQSYVAGREMAYSMFDRTGCAAVVPMATLAFDTGLLQ